jgi:hypothetical protein
MPFGSLLAGYAVIMLTGTLIQSLIRTQEPHVKLGFTKGGYVRFLR